MHLWKCTKRLECKKNVSISNCYSSVPVYVYTQTLWCPIAYFCIMEIPYIFICAVASWAFFIEIGSIFVLLLYFQHNNCHCHVIWRYIVYIIKCLSGVIWHCTLRGQYLVQLDNDGKTPPKQTVNSKHLTCKQRPTGKRWTRCGFSHKTFKKLLITFI